MELTASQNLVQKRTGYLTASLTLSPNHEFRFMLVNQMQRDLASSNMLEAAAALTALCKLGEDAWLMLLLLLVLQYCSLFLVSCLHVSCFHFAFAVFVAAELELATILVCSLLAAEKPCDCSPKVIATFCTTTLYRRVVPSFVGLGAKYFLSLNR